MKSLFRMLVLILVVWLELTGICFAKQVFLKDGSVLECESFWRRNGEVVVKVNRDVVLYFTRSEIDLGKTFKEAKRRGTSAKRSRGHWKPLSAAPAAGVPSPGAQPAASEDGTKSAPVSAPVTAQAALPEKEAPRAQNAAPVAASAPAATDVVQPEPVAGQPLKEPAWFKYLLMLVFSGALIIVSMWFIFRKAGESGIKSVVPFYNVYVLMKISGKPGWWFILLCVPVVGLAIQLLAMLSLAEKFGRSAAFAVGMIFLPMFFFPMLAFGESRYEAAPKELEFTFSEEPPMG